MCSACNFILIHANKSHFRLKTRFEYQLNIGKMQLSKEKFYRQPRTGRLGVH